MSSAHSRVIGRAFALAALTALSALTGSLSPAATTSYEYDALGRLRVVTHDNRIATTYALDPAGNRTQLTDVAVGPTSGPASISVPASSSTGDYSISWGAAAGTVLTYELFESTSPSFSSSTRVHNAATRAAFFSGKPNNTTYYYRVRACANSDCSGFTTGANGVTVFVAPPGAPPTITVPPTIASNFLITWGESTGPVSVYELYDSTSASFASQTLRHSGIERIATISNLPNGTYFYRVRACGYTGCSGYTEGATSVVVSTPPPSLPAPTNLAKTFVANCAWRATWNAVEGAANYIVRDTAGAEQTVVSPIAHVACPINNQNANQPRWVKACSPAGLCSSVANFP